MCVHNAPSVYALWLLCALCTHILVMWPLCVCITHPLCAPNRIRVCPCMHMRVCLRARIRSSLGARCVCLPVCTHVCVCVCVCVSVYLERRIRELVQEHSKCGVCVCVCVCVFTFINTHVHSYTLITLSGVSGNSSRNILSCRALITKSGALN